MFSTTAKNTMLDALTPNQAVLHDGDPGADGSANQVSDPESCTFAAAANGARALSADVEFGDLESEESVTHASFWNSTGPVFLGSQAISSGDTQANASGEYTLKAGTKLQINDPA